MKSVVEQGFFNEFAFNNKALKTFVEFQICWKSSNLPNSNSNIVTSVSSDFMALYKCCYYYYYYYYYYTFVCQECCASVTVLECTMYKCDSTATATTTN